MVAKTSVLDKGEKEEWTAHSSHDEERSSVESAFRFRRAERKEALLGVGRQRRTHDVRYNPFYGLEMAARLALLEREIDALRALITRETAEPPAYVTSKKYPALFAVWDNDDDDVYDAL